MTVSDTAIDGPEDSGSERKWRRRALWLLLALVPATLAVSAYRPVVDYLTMNDLVAREAEPLEDVHFGGSDWRLDNMQTMKDTSSLRIRPGSAPVFVDFTVKIGDANLEQAWLGCKIGLVDAAGRTWLPSYVSNSRVDDMATCNSTVFSGVKSELSGRTLRGTIRRRSSSSTLVTEEEQLSCCCSSCVSVRQWN